MSPSATLPSAAGSIVLANFNVCRCARNLTSQSSKSPSKYRRTYWARNLLDSSWAHTIYDEGLLRRINYDKNTTFIYLSFSYRKCTQGELAQERVKTSTKNRCTELKLTISVQFTLKFLIRREVRGTSLWVSCMLERQFNTSLWQVDWASHSVQNMLQIFHFQAKQINCNFEAWALHS